MRCGGSHWWEVRLRGSFHCCSDMLCLHIETEARVCKVSLMVGLLVWRFCCLGFYLNISIAEWDQPHIKACCTLDLIWQWLSVMCLLSAGFCGHKFSVNTYDRVRLGLQSSGLETAGFYSHWWYYEEKELFLKNWLLHVEEENHVVYNFVLCAHTWSFSNYIQLCGDSFYGGPQLLEWDIKGKGCGAQQAIGGEDKFIICLFIWNEDVWEEEVWLHTVLILALDASESVWLFLCFISWGRIPNYPLSRRLGGPQTWSGCFRTERYLLFLLGTRTTFPQSSHCRL